MASRKKGPVFRVTGLPASQPDDELDATLRTVIDGNLSEEEKSQLHIITAIVPSCYNNEQDRVALVETRGGVPDFLSELVANPLGDWQVEMDDVDISFDQHFFGFTQLYTPKPDAPVTADIIAISGLDGHAYGSWRGKGNLGRMWLRDFLSKDLPCCRTMIYGYNSKLSSHGIDTIMDYGRELMEELKKIRNTEELRQRPLFFIAHSFGGILLAHCLVKAVQTNEDDHPTIATLHRATYGMLLFGIPHKGLVVDDIQKMLAGQGNHPRSALLQQIRDKSDLLAFQLTDFKNLIRDRKIDSQSKRWKRTGEFVTTVDTDSALLHLPDSMEEKIPLDSDHSMIVKFDNKNNRGYTSARDKLREFEQDAPGVVAARFLRARNRPKPSILIPFARDSAFVGREDIITKIIGKHEQAATDHHSRVALVGLGGVGKSQIAIEYAYRVRKSAPQTWVFWVHAANAARFEQAYRDIANKAEIPGREDPKANILKIVYDWLCDERNGQWLMVLDNADDDEFFFDHTRPLESFLAQTPNGRILITSKNRTAAMNLVGPCGRILQVEPMDEEDALALLNARVPFSESNKADAKTLVQALECIPLAITHAAAYIKARAPMITMSDYLRLFRESEANQMRLLGKEGLQDLRRDNSIRHPVSVTWQISFTQIQKTEQSAVDLLALMSMFDRQGIPISLLRNGISQVDFQDALEPLLSFSLVRVEIGMQSFEIHRLVQLSMRKWLEANKQLNKWTKESIRVLTAAFPNGEYPTWMDCQVLFPHARETMGHAAGDEEDRLNQAEIALRAGRFLLFRGEYNTAEEIVRMSVEAREKVLGKEHPDTLSSMNNLALALQDQGKYGEAEKIHRQTLELIEKVLGKEHPNTLSSMNNLALALQDQGKYKEAKGIHRQTLELKEKVLGKEHRDTLMSMNNLANVLDSMGQHEEAEEMHRQTLELSDKVLGKEHPETLSSMNNLASVLKSMGQYKEAAKIHRQTLELKEKVLGKEHPNTLSSMNNLANVLDSMGQYEEAEKMHRQTLELSDKVLGKEHPETLSSRSNLANVLDSMGRYEEAEKMNRQTLELREKVLGKEHIDTLASMNNLANVLYSMGRYEEAEKMHRQTLELREKVLGKEHIDTLASMNNLAIMLKSMGQYEEAAKLHRQTLKLRETVLGKEHPDTLSSMNNLANVLDSMGQYEEAEKMHRQTLKLKGEVNMNSKDAKYGRAPGAGLEEYWGTLVTPGKTPSATFAGLIWAIFANFDFAKAGMLQPREFCAFMSAIDWSPQEFPPIQVLLSDRPALPATLHECDAWLANWYRTFLLDHRMGTREFAPPPPVQPREGRIRKRDQFMHAIMHPPAPVVPGGMPLLTQQGLVQYFMCLALRAPKDLFVRLNRLMDALSTQLIDPKTGRPFEACIPRSCFPSGPDPEEQQKRIMAETQARMWQAENHARQVEQARRQMEAQHIINQNAAQGYCNILSGWTVNAYGNKTYKPGY
ncbi:Nephrocystin-3 [Fusarium oxysporum f. sp. cubense]|uniref:Nephrocystin-3 n=1 Tax=Fusarium oxysporum f. sp. cubense TaxID=61366 RepID=A0A559KSF7_FUSOC|nr:Nephrocystin-3 [Fusarium oxysporum f. sp. cubense]